MVDNNEIQRWRDKYFTLSDEQERNEKDHSSYLNVLHRAMVRISLAAEGQDSELDKHLSSLRKLLRKEPVDQTNINRSLEQVEASILRLDRQRKSNSPQGLESLQTLVDQLSQLNLSKDKKRALKHYGKSLASKGDQLSSYPELLEEYSRLQREALAESIEDATTPQSPPSADSHSFEKGLLSRLFGSKAEQPATSDQSDLTTKVTNEESSLGQDNPDTVIHVLADLLEQLPLSPEVREDAEQLRNCLKELAEAGEWQHVMDGTAELVIKALDKSQKDFEQFLLTLDQQLAQVNNYLGDQGQTEHVRKDSTHELNEIVRNQVGTISTAMGEATDLNHLKASVQDQLKTIIGSMDQFIENESQREQALEQQLQSMQEQLEIVQAESQSIRKKLHCETLKALTDTLTDLPNREAFNERFSLERERFLRYQHSVSIAILDIDHFKHVNDTHGHLVGDRILQAFASKVKAMIRTTDFLARYGGEEFILIMPETTLESATALLEKIRAAIATMPLKQHGTTDTITVSAGLTTFQLGEKAEQLIERADQALYQAKDEGRNQIAIA